MADPLTGLKPQAVGTPPRVSGQARACPDRRARLSLRPPPAWRHTARARRRWRPWPPPGPGAPSLRQDRSHRHVAADTDASGQLLRQPRRRGDLRRLAAGHDLGRVGVQARAIAGRIALDGDRGPWPQRLAVDAGGEQGRGRFGVDHDHLTRCGLPHPDLRGRIGPLHGVHDPLNRLHRRRIDHRVRLPGTIERGRRRLARRRPARRRSGRHGLPAPRAGRRIERGDSDHPGRGRRRVRGRHEPVSLAQFGGVHGRGAKDLEGGGQGLAAKPAKLVASGSAWARAAPSRPRAPMSNSGRSAPAAVATPRPRARWRRKARRAPRPPPDGGVGSDRVSSAWLFSPTGDVRSPMAGSSPAAAGTGSPAGLSPGPRHRRAARPANGSPPSRRKPFPGRCATDGRRGERAG